MRKRAEAIAACEISEIVTCSLGGYDQKILVESKRNKNPVVIFIHGGPGSPLPFSVGSRGLFPEFTDRFTMVAWDQFGCGINHFPIDDSFTTDTFTDMTIDLIKFIKKKYPENQINLFGVSYGSILTVKAAARVPELLDHVIIYGQIINNLAFNTDTCNALEKSLMPSRLKLKLKQMREEKTHTVKDMIRITKWIRKYTEGYVSKTGGKMAIGSMLWGMFTSPDYSWKDFRKTLINPYTKNSGLLLELAGIDLTETLKTIQIPYLILQGSKDIVTPTGTVSAFMLENQNENLTFAVIDDCGHMPGEKGMNKILENIIHFI